MATDEGKALVDAAPVVDASYVEPSWLGRQTFGYMSEVMKRGSKRPLQHDDLLPLRPVDAAGTLYGALREIKERSAAQATHTLAQGLWRMGRRDCLLSALLMLVYACCAVSAPLLLQQYVLAIEEARSGQEVGDKAKLIIGGLAAVVFVGAVCNQVHTHIMTRLGMRMRSAAISAVTRRGLALSLCERQRSSVGEIVNLISNDAQKLFDVMPLVHWCWAAPVQICIVVYFMIGLLSWSAMVGMVVLFGLMPISQWVATYTAKLRKGHMVVSDERVKLCTEIINGIRVVKAAGMEKKYAEKVAELRKEEMVFCRKESYVFGFYVVCLIMFPVFGVLAAFSSHILTEDVPLTAATVFTSLAFFNTLRFPLNLLGTVISIVVQTRVAIKRIHEFLETPVKAECEALEGQPPEQIFLCKGASFSWEPDAAKAAGAPVLSAVDLAISEGEFVAVVGNVGSGKSSLLASLLGETHLTAGELGFGGGGVGYVGQEPFVLEASLRENILFGCDFDAAVYKKVLDACALRLDIAQLPAGDQTAIGERGITLSGGQKARVSLARACYACLALKEYRAVLLDDVLSAVDAHTARHLCNKVLGPSGVLGKEGVCRVVVTNQIWATKGAERIVALASGEVIFEGSSKDFFESNIAAVAAIVAAAELNVEQEAEAEAAGSPRPLPPGSPGLKPAKSESVDVIDVLMTDEDRVVGEITAADKGVFYEATGGFPWWAAVIFGFLGERFSYGWSDWWLSNWFKSDAALESSWVTHWTELDQREEANQTWFLQHYAMLIFMNVMFVVWRCMIGAFMFPRASEIIYERMFWALLRSPAVFFDVTPVGRIINRLAYDTDVVDSQLQIKMMSSFASVWWGMTACCIFMIVSPAMALILTPLLFTFFHVQRYYRRSSRELQRLDSESRSPIQSSFAEALSGSTTLHAAGATVCSRFDEAIDRACDRNNRAVMNFQMAARWLGLRLELLGGVLNLFVLSIAWVFRDDITEGQAGLAIIWAFNFRVTMEFLVKEGTEAEAKFTSVERVATYTQLPSEAALESEGCQELPGVGAIRFDEVAMRYRPGLPLALDGLNFEVEAGARCAIVGRTGAGKSSIGAALFRMRELASGKIEIDGVDISGLGLHELRGRSMATITQDPILFSGTIRSNLDPFDEHTDELLLATLGKCCMLEVVQGLEGGLLAKVADGGDNLSLGQRQLVCVARALLRSPKILLMDEATASVDAATDALIQQTVRGFEGTIICIAHRLNTILDYDKVLVLDRGKVAEQGSPQELLANPRSRFSALVKAYEAN